MTRLDPAFADAFGQAARRRSPTAGADLSGEHVRPGLHWPRDFDGAHHLHDPAAARCCVEPGFDTFRDKARH